MERIGRREFLINTNKYLKPGEWYLTNRGVDEFWVRIELVDKSIERIEPDIKIIKTKEEAKEVVKKLPQKSLYGCGCERGVQFYCPKCGVQ